MEKMENLNQQDLLELYKKNKQKIAEILKEKEELEKKLEDHGD